MFPTLEAAERFSSDKMSALRHELEKLRLPSTVAVVTTGSYARREANQHSDLDFFLLVKNNGLMVDQEYVSEIQNTISGIARRTIGKEPSQDGAFGTCEPTDRMVINIGGNLDENAKITRRILLLLECDWISNEVLFDDTRNRLLDRYLDNKIRDDNIARFLLNDIIRYYRTVCVDFEYKTFEARKDWGIRNVKLRFPRKLLYFSGLLAVARTAGTSEKKKILESLIGKTPIARLKETGSPHVDAILQEYEFYLEKVSSEDNRRSLEAIQRRDEGENMLFDQLRDSSHRMSLVMKKLLSDLYPENHPIHLGVFN